MGEQQAWPTLREVMEEHVEKTLEETGWNVTHAARLLGIPRRTLQRMNQRRYGTVPRPKRPNYDSSRGGA